LWLRNYENLHAAHSPTFWGLWINNESIQGVKNSAYGQGLRRHVHARFLSSQEILPARPRR
jgi:hypothetical protein